MTVKKKKVLLKKEPEIKPIPLSTASIAAGFDTALWSRYVIWHSAALAKRRSDAQMEGVPLSDRKHYVRTCGQCGAPEANGTFSCTCVIHTKCQQWAKTSTSLGPSLGKCNTQEHCLRCCTCLICQTCHKMYKPATHKLFKRRVPKCFCETCQRCSAGCCTCVLCNVCDTKLGRALCACSTKDNPHHTACCQTNDRIVAHGSQVLFINRAPHFAIGSNFQRVRSRRLMSVETEIFGVNQASRFPTFNTTMRSLHCGVVKEGTVPHGFEINSNPASGDAFESTIKGITQALASVKATINIRCGTHCHVDARDFNYADLVNLVHLYYKVEPALFAMLPPWRRVSRFAVPCREQLMKIANNGDSMVKILRDPDLASHYPSTLGKQFKFKPSIAVRIAEGLYQSKTLREQKFIHKSGTNQRLRYMALNLHSWVYRRTVEFRHWPGSMDARELMLWPQICAALLDAAKRLPVHGTKYTGLSIDKLSAHPVEALLQILRPSSRVSSELRPFAESMIRQWSSDFDVWWSIAQIGGSESVVPFKDPSHDGLVLSFDLANKKYTYIQPRHRAAWDIEWLSPNQTGGRYAETGDLHAIPSRGKLLWVAEPLAVRPATVEAPPPLQYPRYFDRIDAVTFANTAPATITIPRPARIPTPIPTDEEFNMDDDYEPPDIF